MRVDPLIIMSSQVTAIVFSLYHIERELSKCACNGRATHSSMFRLVSSQSTPLFLFKMD